MAILSPTQVRLLPVVELTEPDTTAEEISPREPPQRSLPE